MIILLELMILNSVHETFDTDACFELAN